MCEDITERRRTAEVFRETQMELAHANRVATMGQLTASIAHEVNQPIAAVRINAGAALRFLAGSPPDLTEVREALESIINDVDRASAIIDRIRDHVKKAPRRKDRFDLNVAITEVVALARGEVTKNGVLVQSSLATELPPIEGDRVQMQQVMLNLILNAAEAMGSTSGSVRELSISTQEKHPNDIIVSVGDTGPGIDPAHFDRVFEAFYTTKSSGVGMGLSICRSIIDAHGGRLWTRANAPQGAVFEFTLPMASKAS